MLPVALELEAVSTCNQKQVFIMKKHFLTLSDGTPVSSAKNQAKKAYKLKEFTTLSSSQNAIAKSLTNKSFNKAESHAKDISPFILPASRGGAFHNSVDALFIPIRVESNENEAASTWGDKSVDKDFFYYYVSITNTTINLNSWTSIELDSEIDINKITMKDVSMLHGHTNSGWRVRFDDKGFAIEVKHDKEVGITAEVWGIDDEGELSDTISEDSIDFQGLVKDNTKMRNNTSTYSDYMLAMEMNINTPDEINTLFSAGGLNLDITSCVTVLDLESGGYYHGYDALTALDVESHTEEFSNLKSLYLEWLRGKDIDIFENKLEVCGNPWFSINFDDGEAATDSLDGIPTDFQDRLLMTLSTLASK